MGFGGLPNSANPNTYSVAISISHDRDQLIVILQNPLKK